MAFRTTMMLKDAMGSLGCRLSSTRLSHVALPAPLDNAMGRTFETPFILPEFDREIETHTGIDLPDFPFSGSMELMAVPKKKVSKYKRGLRNGPKALKPIPVIIRCRACGRVKLPHFFCCSGERHIPGENNS